jgi:hypothetical protein
MLGPASLLVGARASPLSVNDMAYQKPIFGPLRMDSEQSGCCFFFTNSGQGVYVYNGDGTGGDPGQGQGSVASVGNNNAAVTPLCGTGLPATQPITFGVPVGVTGIYAQVGAGSPEVGVNPSELGVSVLGIHTAAIGGVVLPGL